MRPSPMSIVVIMILVFVIPLGAQIPRLIPYQGVLCDPSGVPKPDATYTLTFRLYESSSGGSALWSEQKNIATTRGLFTTQLGSQVVLSTSLRFDRPYWLSVQVGAEAELTPRIALGTGGYSFSAVNADTAKYAKVAGSGGSNPWLSSNDDIYFSAGDVGIGTSSPSARLHVYDGGALFSGTNGGAPVAGAGTRFMWIPAKSSLRAAYVSGTQWDDANIGTASIALGADTKASGNYSVAMGATTIASGGMSTAFGNNTTASGFLSTAMGYNVSTNGHQGAFILGDNAGPAVSNQYDNQFLAVMDGGFWMYTGRNLATGVYMGGGTSGWTNICDRNKKENFRPIDGESLLLKIRSLSITEWNYKHSDPAIRYIGPVAQDFYAAFHLAGTDSLGINSICIDGVNMAAVQALERRTAELKVTIAELETMKSEVADLKTRLAHLERVLDAPKEMTQQLPEANPR